MPQRLTLFSGEQATKASLRSTKHVTTQDFIKFWGKIFVFVMLEMIDIFTGI
jgi:hypothetical protein